MANHKKRGNKISFHHQGNHACSATTIPSESGHLSYHVLGRELTGARIGQLYLHRGVRDFEFFVKLVAELL